MAMQIHMLLLIAMYFVFDIVAFWNIVRNIQKTHSLSIVSFCRLLYVTILGGMPILTYIGFLCDIKNGNLCYDTACVWSLYISAFFTFIVYVFFNLGYKTLHPKMQNKKGLSKRGLLLYSTILMLLSAISLLLWARGYGGVSELIANANAIRAGFVGSKTNTAFFKHFVPTAMLVSFLTFRFLFIDKQYKENNPSRVRKNLCCLYTFLLFAVSVILSSLYILANDGRLLAGAYIALFFIALMKNDYEIKHKKLSSVSIRAVLLAGIAFLFILNADAFLSFFRGETVALETDEGFLPSVIQEFSYTQSSMQIALLKRSEGTLQWMLGNDLLNGLTAWLPTSLKPFNLIGVWDYNTLLLNSGSYGQSPTTIVSQSYYDAGFIGILCIPFLYGMLVKKIEKNLGNGQGSNIFATMYLVLCFYLSKGVAYFSCSNIMLNLFFVVVAWILYRIIEGWKI